MAHTHEHDESYFLDQIFSIALCGALGGIAVILFVRKKMLTIILDQRFHPFVLAGGITLLVLVVIRAVALWQQAGVAGGHHHHHDGHEHDHDHNHHHHHDHDHAHCGHDHHHEHGEKSVGLTVIPSPDADHEHGHDHGWAPWRYTILMLPVVLFLLNLPNDGFSARFKPVEVEDGLAETAASTVGLLVSPGGPGPLLAATALYPGRNNRYGEGVVTKIDIANLRFSELERAAMSPSLRSEYTGKAVTIVGKFDSRGDSSQFGLVRFKMNCCAADALPLNAVIMINPSWTEERLNVAALQQKWVKVTGRVFFLKKRGSENDHVAAVILFPDKEHRPDSLVEVIDQPANPYAQ